MNLISCTLRDKLSRLGHQMIAQLGDIIGLLQAAKWTGTFCGIIQAFQTGWHFFPYVVVSMPTAWGHLSPPTRGCPPATMDTASGASAKGGESWEHCKEWCPDCISNAMKASCCFSEDTEIFWFTSTTRTGAGKSELMKSAGKFTLKKLNGSVLHPKAQAALSPPLCAFNLSEKHPADSKGKTCALVSCKY